MGDIQSYLPEDIIIVDLKFLHKMDLVDYYDSTTCDPSLTQYFQVVESEDKITLVNEEFVVWIVPEKMEDMTFTYALIATNHERGRPKAEICFVASGIYNCSRLVLRVLEKLLFEIRENHMLIKQLENKKRCG